MPVESPARPNRSQLRWLKRGLTQPGGKLPLFDRKGQEISEKLVLVCLDAGWAEPWFANPLKPDWQVCRLTETGRYLAETLEEDVPEPPPRLETTAIKDPLVEAETVDDVLEIIREDPDEPRLF